MSPKHAVRLVIKPMIELLRASVRVRVSVKGGEAPEVLERSGRLTWEKKKKYEWKCKWKWKGEWKSQCIRIRN